MNIWHAAALGAAMLIAPLAATAQTQPPPTKPVATVNGIPIPQRAFDQLLRMALSQGQVDSPRLRESITKQLVARELFLQEAAKQGLDQDPEVVAIAEEAKRNAMIQRYLRTQIQIKPVTDEQVRAEYERAKGLLGPKEYKLRVMQLPTDQRARDMRDQMLKGKDFADLARQWSLAPSSGRGGELDWISFKSPAREGETNDLPLPIAQAVERLQKGKVSDPLEIAGRWWLVKLEDARATKVPSYEQTRAMFADRLAAREAERTTTELLQRLIKSAKVTQ